MGAEAEAQQAFWNELEFDWQRSLTTSPLPPELDGERKTTFLKHLRKPGVSTYGSHLASVSNYMYHAWRRTFDENLAHGGKEGKEDMARITLYRFARYSQFNLVFFRLSLQPCTVVVHLESACCEGAMIITTKYNAHVAMQSENLVPKLFR